MNTKGNWMLILALSLISAPLVIMYGFQLIDSVTRPAPPPAGWPSFGATSPPTAR